MSRISDRTPVENRGIGRNNSAVPVHSIRTGRAWKRIAALEKLLDQKTGRSPQDEIVRQILQQLSPADSKL